MKKIVVLTGAGMSAESGISTFRDSGGLWEQYPVEQVASHEGWERDPELVTRFYNERRKQLFTCKPNEGHRLLAQLEEKYGWKVLLIVILATAIVTGIVHNIFSPRTMLLGASGVAFAFILLTSFTEFKEGEIPMTFILVAIIYLGQQLWDGLTVDDNISNLSHIIGGIVGSAAGYMLNIRKKRY